MTHQSPLDGTLNARTISPQLQLISLNHYFAIKINNNTASRYQSFNSVVCNYQHQSFAQRAMPMLTDAIVAQGWLNIASGYQKTMIFLQKNNNHSNVVIISQIYFDLAITLTMQALVINDT